MASKRTLDALGRHADAQQQRWTLFERSLSAEHLRAYLKRLPDFDDIEAEARALDHTQNFQRSGDKNGTWRSRLPPPR